MLHAPNAQRSLLSALQQNPTWKLLLNSSCCVRPLPCLTCPSPLPPLQLPARARGSSHTRQTSPQQYLAATPPPPPASDLGIAQASREANRGSGAAGSGLLADGVSLHTTCIGLHPIPHLPCGKPTYSRASRLCNKQPCQRPWFWASALSPSCSPCCPVSAAIGMSTDCHRSSCCLSNLAACCWWMP